MTRHATLAAVLAGAVALGAAGAHRADASPIAIFIDFEGDALTDSLTSLPVVAGTLARPGSVFGIADIDGVGPPDFGARSLSPFPDSTNPAPFVLDFDVGFQTVSLDAGDFGQDEDTVELRAYAGPGGTGALLATATATLPGGPGPDFGGTTLTVSAAGDLVRSIVFAGGSAAFPNSVYWDNIRAFQADLPAIPAPVAAALLGAGLLGLALVRRRR